MAEDHSITTPEVNEPQATPEKAKSKAVASLSFEDEEAFVESLKLIKAVGDTLVCIGNPGKEVDLFPETFLALGNLLIDKAELAADSLGFSI